MYLLVISGKTKQKMATVAANLAQSECQLGRMSSILYRCFHVDMIDRCYKCESERVTVIRLRSSLRNYNFIPKKF